MSNQMEQIEMRFQSSVNATECILELFGELAGEGSTPPISQPPIGHQYSPRAGTCKAVMYTNISP